MRTFPITQLYSIPLLTTWYLWFLGEALAKEIVVVAEYPKRYRGQSTERKRPEIKQIIKRARAKIKNLIKGNSDSHPWSRSLVSSFCLTSRGSLLWLLQRYWYNPHYPENQWFLEFHLRFWYWCQPFSFVWFSPFLAHLEYADILLKPWHCDNLTATYK